MLDLLNPDWATFPKLVVTGTAKADKRGWTIPTNAGSLSMTAHAAGIFRLRLGDEDPPNYDILMGKPNRPSDTELSGSESNWVVSAQGCGLSFDRNGRIEFSRGERILLMSRAGGGDVISRHPPALARLADRQWFAGLTLGSGDAVYGLGEKGGRLDRRGQLITSWTADQEDGDGEVSRKNCPLAWSPRGWGIFVHTPGKVTHGVGFAQWSPRSYGLLVEDAIFDVFLMAGADGAEILERYTVLTGRPASPPLWSLGAWHGWGKTNAEDEAKFLQEGSLPGDVLVTETTDPIVTGSGDITLRRCIQDVPVIPTTDSLHDEMRAKGWLVKDADADQPYHHAASHLGIAGGLVDFTHADAYAHWRDRARDRMSSGVAALAPEFVGVIADNAVAANGDTGRRLNNVYSLLHSRCLNEAGEHTGLTSPMIFAEAGWAGCHRASFLQGGRTDASWEGLADALRGALSWGLSGGPCQSVTISDDFGEPLDSAVFLRWLQAATFGSHLHLRGFNASLRQSLDDVSREIVHDFLELRYRLLPYLEGVLAEATAAGLPVMRAMPLSFPSEPESWVFDTQFMFGPDLLIAPVVMPDDRVRVYLPSGDWVNYWTDEQFTGGCRLDLTVPEAHIPIFVREGAVLPFGPSVRNTGELGDRTQIERLVVYGKPTHAPSLARHNITVLGDRLSGVPEGVVVELINSD